MIDPHHWLIGKQFDDYKVDKALGAGGMARVYRAFDTKLRRYVALKVIAPDYRTDEDHSRRFEREAQSVARLDHSNIVRIYRFGEVDGLYYIAMQYIEGADVEWLIQDYRSTRELIPLSDIVRIVDDIGAALDYAHSKNIIHRDVKPGNIIVNNQGHAILTDFGLSMLSDLGTEGQSLVSPHYIAPEQAVSSSHVVPQSDLYSLGVSLFEMLTGEVPFDGGMPTDIAMRHVSDPAPRPSQFNKVISPEIDEVVLRSLAKEPSDRYQTGAEMSRALQTAVANWLPVEHPSTQQVRRPSLLRAPDKVSSLVKSRPLPNIPPEAMTPDPAPVLEPSLAQTKLASSGNAAPPTIFARTGEPGMIKLSPLMFGGVLFMLGLMTLLVFLLATRGTASNVTIAATPTDVPTIAPTFTELPAVQPAIAPSPTLIPATAIAVSLPTLQPTVGQVMPPDDRTAPPSGSRRLGEFAVEAYCNDQGYAIRLVNNRSDWACTNRRTGSIVLTLGPAEFDQICQSRYNNPAAFAIKDQKKAIQAYNWSCYEYLAPGTVMPPTAGAASITTPSLNTLPLRFGPDWIALVNVANTPLSLENVEFRQGDRILKATAWGQPVLMPGACIRLYWGNTAPNQPPASCTSIFDSQLDEAERGRWMEGPVVIAINPAVLYCYPARKCT
jgi:serine/threonine protein kinase